MAETFLVRVSVPREHAEVFEGLLASLPEAVVGRQAPLIDTGVDLRDSDELIVLAYLNQPPETETVAGLRRVFVENAVLCFPAQRVSAQDQARFPGFFGRVDFGTDFEKHLNFYVECRAAFLRLDPTLTLTLTLTHTLTLTLALALAPALILSLSISLPLLRREAFGSQ